MNLLKYLLVLLVVATLFLSSIPSVRADDAGDAQADDEVDVYDDDVGEPIAEDEYADDDEYEEEELGDHEDVSVYWSFPDNADKVLELGEITTLLVGISNIGESTFNISSLQVHLHSVFDYSYYIQNFTRIEPAFELDPQSEVTIAYRFVPHERLEPLEFWMSAVVDFTDDDDVAFQTTFFNESVVIVEKPEDVNTRLFFTYFLSMAALGVLGYGALVMFAGKPKKRAETGTSTTVGDDDQWGGVYKQQPSGGSRSSKKKSSSKKRN